MRFILFSFTKMAEYEDLPIEIRLMILYILKRDYAWRRRLQFEQYKVILERKRFFHQWQNWKESTNYTKMFGRLYTLAWYWYPLETHKRRFVMYKVISPNDNMRISFYDNELYWNRTIETGKTFY